MEPTKGTFLDTHNAFDLSDFIETEICGVYLQSNVFLT